MLSVRDRSASANCNRGHQWRRIQGMDREALLDRARGRGVNPLVYWLAARDPAAVLPPVLPPEPHRARAHPGRGPVHHRLQPPVVPRPLRHRHDGPPAALLHDEEGGVHQPAGRVAALLAGRLPDRSRLLRPGGDGHHARDPRARRRRPDLPRGHAHAARARSGARSAASGAWRSRPARPSIPVAIIGSEAVRKGWRIRPHKVRIRAGAPLTFPHVQEPSRHLAAAVTDRIWPCVELQWEWLGGTPRVRRAAVIGAGAWGTSLARRARARRPRGRPRHPRRRAARRRSARCPTPSRCTAPSEIALAHHDLVCLAVTAARAARGRRRARRADPRARRRARALQGPRRPARDAALRLRRRAHARRTPSPASAARAPPPTRSTSGATLVVACASQSFLAQIGDVLRVARFDVQRTTDVTGVELAVAARNAAVLAASAAAPAGASAADAAADRVLAEVDAYARRRGGHPESFADLAGHRRRRPGARRPAAARRRPARGRRRRPGRRRPRRRRRRPRRARALGRGRDASPPARGRGALPE